MRRGLGAGSAAWWAMGGQAPWPVAGTAAGHSHVLHSSPPRGHSVPKAMGTSPACAKMGSLLRSLDGLMARQKNLVCSRLRQLQLAGYRVGWREACWVGRGLPFLDHD